MTKLDVDRQESKIILGITGATGMLYIPELLDLLQKEAVTVHGVISDAGRQVLSYELGLRPEKLIGVEQWFDCKDFTAPFASGSSCYRAMVILPCTMGTLGAIAAGVCRNLIHRAADVTLKERRPLILAPRETPLNKIHLQNMLTTHEAGAIICPPMPSFYQQPKDLHQMARNFAGRILDQLGIHSADLQRWQGSEK